jgi:membrane protein
MALVSQARVQAGRRYMGIVGRTLVRLWGRDVMLYVGGVSFFALLAVFPGLALLISLYGLVFTPDQAASQAEALSQLLPHGARDLFENELTRLTTTPTKVVSAQSALAVIIGAYAAHRGFKALLAGLTFIHDEEQPHGFLRFNVLAFVVAISSFALATVISGLIVAFRVLKAVTHVDRFYDFGVFDNAWVWAGLGLTLGLSCVYRYAMSHSGPVAWRAAVVGGVAAAGLSLVASWASAFYVDQVVHLGATYGSVATVVVFLIWLSWNVNAVFFGGALATEMEIALDTYHAEIRVEEPSAEAVPPSRPFPQ